MSLKRQRYSERQCGQKRCSAGCYLLLIAALVVRKEVVEASRMQRAGVIIQDARRNARVSEREQWRSTALMDRAIVLRGGSDEADIPKLPSDEESEDNLKEEKRPSRWPIGSLFDLNVDIQAEASADTSMNHGARTNARERRLFPFLRKPQAKVSLSSNTGRGGALVKEKPRNRFLWLAPLDTSRVAPTASRLLHDSIEHDSNYDLRETDDSELAVANHSSTASRITASVVASAKSVKKVWWVNTWADQLPDQEDEAQMAAHIQNQEDDEQQKDNNNNNNNKSYGGDDDKTPIDEEMVETTASTETKKSKQKKKSKKKAKTEGEAEMQDDDVTIEPSRPELRRQPSLNETVTNLETDMMGQEVPAKRPSLQDAVSLPPSINASSVQSKPESPYTSSGYWQSIDRLLTIGYADKHPAWRVSSRLRKVRKAAAKVTGLHGILSGKPHYSSPRIDDEQLGLVRRRLQAIDRARRNVDRAAAIAANTTKTRRRFFRRKPVTDDAESQYAFILKKSSAEEQEEQQRMERVKAIDKQIQEAQRHLMELACEKDVLQRRHNPFWNYTTDEAASESAKDPGSITASRKFNFPPQDLVEEYLDMLFYSGRLDKLNHTDLWRNENFDDDDDDDFLTSPASREEERKRRNGNGNSGSWLLRNGIGEKIGETAEKAAYKAVCSSVMGVIARGLSSLHGVNVMSYSDIRLSTDYAPDLPPIAAGIIPGSGSNNYAREAIHDAMRRGAKKRKRSAQHEAFIQRDAVVETLTSQCQIAAPLMNLFPLAWQRAMLANIITLVTAVIADFCEGIEFQILGHRLSFAFTPITEEDMIQGMVRGNFNNPRRTNQEQFEAAVRATAEDLSENLKFLDRWHERALGGGLLRTQIATLIARVVLTLVDDVLSGSRMDLWAAHAGGPRLVAGLEYRTTTPHNVMGESVV